MILRNRYLTLLNEAISNTPITALLGPRQCGKTTLARQVLEQHTGLYLDLENPRDLARLAAPMLALENEKGLIVIDEIQRKRDLFPILRVLADSPTFQGKFLILGSAAPQLVRGVSESLAGRVTFVDLSGFSLNEVDLNNSEKLWVRGGFPRSFLADKETQSYSWREGFIRTFLERDIPQLGISIPASALHRFWTMVAHYHGNVWNAAEFSRSLGSSEGTARRYLDILAGAYVVRQLQPWHENLKKRQVKSPKVYIRDSGLLHTLLSISDKESLMSHPKLGASWEGYVVEQLIIRCQTRDAYYWSTHSGAELDLLLFLDGQRIGVEIKFTDSPKVTRSLRVAFADLKLNQAFIIYPGNEKFLLDEKITAYPINNLPQFLT